jgi:superfamily II DNA helicase RecQ
MSVESVRSKSTKRRSKEPRGGEKHRARNGGTKLGDSPVEEALRGWRAKEAKKRGVPAFRILTDRTLVGLARARPSDETELLDVSGIGPAVVAKYGKALLAILRTP